VALLYSGAHSFGYVLMSGIAGSYDSSISILLRDLHISFLSGCANYISTNNVELFNYFFSPTSSLAFVVICVIDDSHLDWGEVESQCHFDLHFLSVQKC
jgi:hypothetical protein